MPEAANIDEVVARLQSLESSLGTGDGVHWFNRLYLEVTLAVREYVRTQPLSVPPFLEQLDVFFGNAYFDALDAAAGHGSMAAAWSPLFDARADRDIAPLQFAVAGMNAHIDHDLARGVVATCGQLDMTPGSGQKHDYDAVNAILKATEARVKRWLLTDAVKELDHEVAPADDVAVIWSIEAAREAAWLRGQVLWHLRDEPALTDAYLAVNDRETELAGRAILLHLPKL
jgi:hypothetical protein